MSASNYFTCTEKQRKALNALWRGYDKTVKRNKNNPSAIIQARRVLEDQIAANLNGFDDVAEARRSP